MHGDNLVELRLIAGEMRGLPDICYCRGGPSLALGRQNTCGVKVQNLGLLTVGG